jgi:3-hydroxyacyl-[acyl-carrier-protein] dehydratase
MSESAYLSGALRHLPHGEEFRFLDRLLKLDPGKSATAEYLIRGDEPFLKGHFPGAPLFPGVLLVEAGAQLAGVVAQNDPAHQPLANLKLTALRNVKIFSSAQPGETLALQATIVGRMANLVQAEIVVQSGAKRLLEGFVTLSGDSQLSGS